MLTAPPPPPDARVDRDELVRKVLTSTGFSEAVTFGFIETSAARAFEADPSRPASVALANPLSAKFDVLRPSLVPGLVDAVAHKAAAAEDVAAFHAAYAAGRSAPCAS